MAELSDGVSVSRVLGLAPHVRLAAEPTQTEGTPPDTWGPRAEDATVTNETVEAFIADVTGVVDGRLLRRHYIKTEAVLTSIENTARGIITVGAAATLISAVFPAKAGINDQTSYSAELWARFNTDLDALAEAVDQALKDQDDPKTGGSSVGSIRGTFREASITDDMQW